MASGERMPLAALDAPASGRMAVGEAITNLLAAPVPSLSSIKLSCNWMAAAGEPGEDAALYDTVRAVGLELCPTLGISVPVGKDSMSMRTRWTDDTGDDRQVTSPVSLVVTAFAALPDVRTTYTPQLLPDTAIVLVDLGGGRHRMGGSMAAQVSGAFGTDVPDLDDPAAITNFADAMSVLRDRRLITAYHDRSDGGLWAAVCEMAFAGAIGVDLAVSSRAELFTAELGVLLGVPGDTSPRPLARVLPQPSPRRSPTGSPKR